MSIDFTGVHADGHKDERVNAACFAGVDYNKYVSFVYPALIAHDLNDVHLRFWIRFMKSFMVDLPWTYEFTKVGEKITRIVYTLHSLSPNRAKNLFYCTAFRYTHEYSHHIIPFYNLRKTAESSDDLFHIFQKMHYDKKVGAYGHNLICGGPYGGGDGPPITIPEILTNFANPNIRMVYRFWTKPASTSAPQV